MSNRDEHGRELPPGVYVEEPAPRKREPTPDDFTRAVRAAVRLVGFLGSARVVSLVREDIEGRAGRALTGAERADVERRVREEMVR